jgi:hypothetical protein
MVRAINPKTFSRQQQRSLVDIIVSWTGHPSEAYAVVPGSSTSGVRWVGEAETDGRTGSDSVLRHPVRGLAPPWLPPHRGGSLARLVTADDVPIARRLLARGESQYGPPMGRARAQYHIWAYLGQRHKPHPSSYRNFLNQPLREVRKGLQILFDESRDVRTRLEEVVAEKYLAGFRMRTLSLLLYWRNPEMFPPYNHRTLRFLNDFNYRETGMSDSSPRCYETWLRWAARLSQRVGLPTVGHVDRMVERYYEDVTG